jgi:hypothetical protein
MKKYLIFIKQLEETNLLCQNQDPEVDDICYIHNVICDVMCRVFLCLRLLCSEVIVEQDSGGGGGHRLTSLPETRLLPVSTSRILAFFSSSKYRSSTHRSSRFLLQDFNQIARSYSERRNFSTASRDRTNLMRTILLDHLIS